MVFSSPVFLFLFLPLTLLLVLLFRGLKAQNTVLLLASLLFYAWGEQQYVLLMLAVALFNHGCALLLERTGRRQWVVVLAVVVDLACLIWFKYAGFLGEQLAPLFRVLGVFQAPLDPIHLPIGVSFFIFHSLSYVLDVHRRTAPAQGSPGVTALYIAFFPQLVAGPIIRYHDVAEQFTRRVVDLSGFAYGVRRFVVGLAKKVLVADLCARIADPVFALPDAQLTAPVAWLGMVAYAVQIYFDFSGYSDMAIGLARMFGFRFIENFNRPYAAASLREFWKRWHISLTNFFRDYLYIPLGGNRRGPVRTYLNLVIVFLLTGLWHGASWTFVVWGALHGFFMLLERAGLGALLDRWPRIIGRVYMLLVVLMAWVFFRCDDITHAWRYVVVLFTPGHGVPRLVHPEYYLTTDAAIALAVGVVGGLGLYDRFMHWCRSGPLQGREALLADLRDVALLLLFVFTAMAVATRTFDPFIYFRF
jgi:alginate O-acetyltransferase complex protein AlgI